jgi:hypothetical protein
MGPFQYPPVFVGTSNCALAVYKKYVPKGKNGATIEKFLTNLDLNLKEGFTEETATLINKKYGYGCLLIDQLGRTAIQIPSKNKMKLIMLQAFDQHVYESAAIVTKKDGPAQGEPDIEGPIPFNNIYEIKWPIAAKYEPTRVEFYTGDWYDLAVRICDQGPKFIYRTDLDNTTKQYIAGLTTANVEYKRPSAPPALGLFDEVDAKLRSLRERYPHNFTKRDPLELEYLRLADFHGGVQWYDKPQRGFEVDFNQAYRAAAELKLSGYTHFAFPHYPVYWTEVYDGQQAIALDIITGHSGFAHLSDINFAEVPNPLREYLTKQCHNRAVFTSPEITYLADNGATFTIQSMAFNQYSQNIDWDFADDADNTTRTKNINRVLIGKLITDTKSFEATLLVSKAVTEYYRHALGDTLTRVDDTSEKYDRISYEKEVPPAYKQQYHIHAYILAYLRIAMWELLADIDPGNVIKINVDAVHLKQLPPTFPVDIDNSPLGRPGAIKIRPARTRGTPSQGGNAVQLIPDVAFPDKLGKIVNEGRLKPQRLLLGGAAGSGKTRAVSKQTSLTCVSAFSNKLTIALQDSLSKHEDKDVNVKTLHKQYDVAFCDHTYHVKRIPTDHLHNLDDILLAPPKLIKNIVNALISYGKRITITYGAGQATMDKPAAIKLVEYLQKRFSETILPGSSRMEKELYELSEEFRNDPEIDEVVELQHNLRNIEREREKEVVKLIPTRSDAAGNTVRYPDNIPEKESAKVYERYRGVISQQRHDIYRAIKPLLAKYVQKFRYVDTAIAIREYLEDVPNNVMVTPTNYRRLELNGQITKASPTHHKYRYLTHVRKAKKIFRKKGEIVVVPAGEVEPELLADLEKGRCEHMHVYTVHSCQGETIEGNIYIDITAMFDPDIFYSAITRPRKMSNIVLFGEFAPPPDKFTYDTQCDGCVRAQVAAFAAGKGAYNACCGKPECKAGYEESFRAWKARNAPIRHPGAPVIPEQPIIIPEIPEPTPKAEFYHPSICKFADASMIRVDLGGESGNRCFNFGSYKQYVHSDIIRKLMSAMGDNFNLNEVPEHTNIATRLWLDIDIPVSSDKVELISQFIDSATTAGDNKVLQSTKGKLHIVVNIDPALPEPTYEEYVVRGRLVPAGVVLDYSARGKTALLYYFSRKIREIMGDNVTDKEWKAAFDMGARGMRAAYSIKAKGGKCESRGYYEPIEMKGMSADIDDKISAIYDCSIYKPVTGTVRPELYMEISEYAREYDTGVADRLNKLKEKYRGYEVRDGSVYVDGREYKITSEFINDTLKNMPEYRAIGANWRTTCQNVANIMPNDYDPHYLLNEWSKRGDAAKEYNEKNNQDTWRMIAKGAKMEYYNNSACWLLWNAGIRPDDKPTPVNVPIPTNKPRAQRERKVDTKKNEQPHTPCEVSDYEHECLDI